MNIPLNNAPGKFAIVDPDDFQFLSRREWRLDDKGYPVSNISTRTIKLHNFILPSTNARIIDHENGDKLDNRKSNLRLVSPAGNAQNRAKISKLTTSAYKGVWKDSKTGKYRSRIVANGKYHKVGSFDSEIEAAKAWDRMAMQLHGANARLNFPSPMDAPESDQKDSP